MVMLRALKIVHQLEHMVICWNPDNAKSHKYSLEWQSAVSLEKPLGGVWLPQKFILKFKTIRMIYFENNKEKNVQVFF